MRPQDELDEVRRRDDTFLRRIIWLLITVVITSLGGWIWTIAVLQTQVMANTKSISEMQGYTKDVIEMKIMLGSLMKKSDETHLLVLQVVNEQARQSNSVIDAREHIKNRKVHK